MGESIFFNDFVMILVYNCIVYQGLYDLMMEYIFYHIDEYVKELKRG